MAVDIETIGIAVDTTGVVKGERELKSFGATADKASRNADGLTSSIGSLAKGFLGAYAGIQGFAAAVKSLDQFARYEAIIKNATRTQAEFNKAMSESTRIANAAQSDIDGIARTYARFSNALREFNATQGQVSDLTETVALALKANGASATETSSAMLQLSQAFGAGRLSGDEFRSMAEAAPNLMRDLARSIGVPVGALKDMGAEGQLTTEILLKAFTNPELLATYRKQASEIRTIGGAWQELVNTITVGLAKVDKELGTSKFFQGLLGQFSMGIKVLTGQTETYLDGVIKKSVQAGEAILNALGIQSKAQKDADAERRKRAGSGIFGDANPITYGNSVMPGILSQPVGAIDVNKLHKAQEEKRRKLELINQERKQAADAAAKYERELAQAESAWRANKANEYQEELRKKYEKAKQEEARIAEELAKEEYKSKLKYMDMLSKEAEQNYNEAQKAAKKAADDLEKEYNRISDNLSRSLTDAIYRGFERGYSFVDNFIETLKNTFKTLVLQPSIEFLIKQSGLTSLLAGVGSFFSGTATAGEQSGSIFDQGLKIIDAIDDGFSSLNFSFGKSIEELGAIIYNGNGGLIDEIGGFMGQYGQGISQAIGYAGAALAGFNYLKDGNYIGAGLTAAGAAFGGPVGAAIGAAFGSVFGGKKKIKRYGTMVQSSYTDGVTEITGVQKYGDRLLQSAIGPLKDLSKSFYDVLGPFLKSMGANSDMRSQAIFSVKKKSEGIFQGVLDGNAYGVKSEKGESFEVFQLRVMTQGVVAGIKASKDISNEVKSLFNNIFSDVYGNDRIARVQTLMTGVLALNDSTRQLSDTFGITVDQVSGSAKVTAKSSAELVAFITNVATAANSLKTAGQVIIGVRDDVTKSFNEVLSGALPATLKEFDAILKGIDKTSPDGLKDFGELFNIRDQLSKYYSSVLGLKTGVEDSIFGISSPQEQMQMRTAKLAQIFGDLNMEIPGSIADLIALGKSIDYSTESGLDLALAFPALVDMFNQTKEAANALTKDLSANYFSTRADYMSAKASDSPQSYIKNQAQMNAEMLAQIKKLQQDGEDTKAVMLAVAEYTAKFQRTIDDWDTEGMPAVRVDA